MGLDGADALVLRAEGLLQERERRREASRAELREALAASEDRLPGDLQQLGATRLAQLRAGLVRGLAGAKSAGLPDDEIREAELLRRRVHNAIEDAKGQVRVFCRVRPLSGKELGEGDLEAVQIIDDMTLEVPRGGQFSFDSVFAPGTQEEVFEECRDLIQSAVDGHNVTIFAYGQTGAGKTFTLYGTPEQEGIAPRAIVELFRILDGLRERHSISVTGSMVELYNNTLIDLLRPAGSGAGGGRPLAGGGGAAVAAGTPKLSVRQDRTGSVQVDRLFEREARDAAELCALLDRGLAQRRVAASAMNIRSSRSHLVFTIHVTSVNLATRETLSGKLLLCDLGGSERLKKTEAAGDRRREAIEINKSLSALGDVIEAVARRQRQVPYRNHKLTQIMQDSLGGTAKTLMFVNCSPAWSNLSETLMSLTYAARTKRITNLGTPSCSSSSPVSRNRSDACLGFGLEP